MELQDLVAAITSFSGWPHIDKIKFFAWYLHAHRQKEHFQSKDIGACFDALHLARPSSVSPFLAALVKKKPPELLQTKGGFRLENRIRAAFDRKCGQRESTIHVHKLLTELPNKIQIPAERGYLEEALICFEHKAFRAAVVMCWNLAFDHLCEFVLIDSTRLTAFNNQLPKSYSKASIAAISQRDDFTELKEFQVLQVCASANIITGNTHRILKEKLNRRNIAAHPSSTTTSQFTAEEFIKDLIENFVLKLI